MQRPSNCWNICRITKQARKNRAEERHERLVPSAEALLLSRPVSICGVLLLSLRPLCGRHFSANAFGCGGRALAWPDRKSTRLNSSHSQISYAVFCLQKKKLP